MDTPLPFPLPPLSTALTVHIRRWCISPALSHCASSCAAGCERASERLSAYRIHNLYALSASAGCRCTQLPTSHPADPPPFPPPVLAPAQVAHQFTHCAFSRYMRLFYAPAPSEHCCIFSNNKIFSGIAINLLSL